MKIKLTSRIGLLLLMIITLSLVSVYHNFSIENDTEKILKDNYNTLEYSRNMLLSLNEYNSNKEKAIAQFEANLTKQMGNITEVGEDKVTYMLQNNFDSLKKDWKDENLKSKIRQNIFHLLKLNTIAIKKKSDIIKQSAEKANFGIAILGTFSFLVAFNLLLNLPDRNSNSKKS